MRPSEALSAKREAARALALQYGFEQVRVFGSVSRNEDTPESDLDIVVFPPPRTTLLDLIGFEQDLEKLLGVRVQVLTHRELSRRWRDEALATSQAL